MKDKIETGRFRLTYIFRAAVARKGLFAIQVLFFAIITLLGLCMIGQWYGIGSKVKQVDKLCQDNIFYIKGAFGSDEDNLLMQRYHIDQEFTSYVGDQRWSLDSKKADTDSKYDTVLSTPVMYGKELLDELDLHIVKGRNFSKYGKNEIILGYQWKGSVSIGEQLYLSGRKEPFKVVGIAGEDNVVSGISSDENSDDTDTCEYENLVGIRNGDYILVHPDSKLEDYILSEGVSLSFLVVPENLRENILSDFQKSDFTIHEMKSEKENYYDKKYYLFSSNCIFIYGLVIFLLIYLRWMGSYIYRRLRGDIIFYCSSGVGIKKAYTVIMEQFLVGIVVGWLFGTILYFDDQSPIINSKTYIDQRFWQPFVMLAILLIFYFGMQRITRWALIRKKKIPADLLEPSKRGVAYFDVPIPEYLTAEMAVGAHFLFVSGMSVEERKKANLEAMESCDITWYVLDKPLIMSPEKKRFVILAHALAGKPEILVTRPVKEIFFGKWERKTCEALYEDLQSHGVEIVYSQDSERTEGKG